jgi:hypothetical protein
MRNPVPFAFATENFSRHGAQLWSDNSVLVHTGSFEAQKTNRSTLAGGRVMPEY